MLDLINTHQVSVLLFNPQTRRRPPSRSRRRAAGVAAGGHGHRTLPDGLDYLTWQRDTADELAGNSTKRHRRIDSHLVGC
jgi:zinc/manganese transport system substrate-binding protein